MDLKGRCSIHPAITQFSSSPLFSSFVFSFTYGHIIKKKKNIIFVKVIFFTKIIYNLHHSLRLQTNLQHCNIKII